VERATDVYHRAYQTMLDFYMDQADSTAGMPEDLRGRFNCDGSMWLYVYERERMPSEFARVIEHVRAGSLTVPLNSLVILAGRDADGGRPARHVLRGTARASLRPRPRSGRADGEPDVARGVASLWSGAGARYSWKGICDCGDEHGGRRSTARGLLVRRPGRPTACS